ncbi:MAG: NAD-dependent epimerase/dehydratase family protein [Vicinamibacterales bacterium]
MTSQIDEAVSTYYRKRSVLVTGGAGFAGSHVVEALVAMGARVRVPVRESTKLSFLADVISDIEIVDADLFDAAEARGAVEGQDIVLHLAAAKGGGISHSMLHHGSLFRSNMLSAIQMLDAARDAQVERFVAVSSACVYPRDSQAPTPEEDGVRDAPEPTNAGYGWSKRMVEFLSGAYREEFGLNIGIVRPFNLYGPRDDFFRPSSHVIPGIVTRLFDGERPLTVWGSGKQTRSFLYVDDLVRGVLLAGARTDVTGPLNLGSNEEISIADLARLIVEVSGLGVDVVLDPSKPDGQPRRACDTSRAKVELGFEARTTLREGLAKTIEWYLRARDAVAA